MELPVISCDNVRIIASNVILSPILRYANDVPIACNRASKQNEYQIEYMSSGSWVCVYRNKVMTTSMKTQII